MEAMRVCWSVAAAAPLWRVPTDSSRRTTLARPICPFAPRLGVLERTKTYTRSMDTYTRDLFQSQFCLYGNLNILYDFVKSGEERIEISALHGIDIMQGKRCAVLLADSARNYMRSWPASSMQSEGAHTPRVVSAPLCSQGKFMDDGHLAACNFSWAKDVKAAGHLWDVCWVKTPGWMQENGFDMAKMILGRLCRSSVDCWDDHVKKIDV